MSKRLGGYKCHINANSLSLSFFSKLTLYCHLKNIGKNTILCLTVFILIKKGGIYQMFFLFNILGRLLYGKDYEELSRRASKTRRRKPRRRKY